MRVRFAATLILGAITLACSGEITSSLTDPAATQTPANVFIVPLTSTDIIIGTSVSLQVAVKNANGGDITGLPIVWSSSDASVATVSQAGLLTAVKVGVANITGTVGARSATVAITVKPVPVSKVVLAFRTPIFPGETSVASVTVQDASGSTLTGRTIAWSSSDPSVATVSSTGLITAVSFGAASVTATVEGVQASSLLIVNIPPVATVAVSLSAQSVAGIGSVNATAVLKDALGNSLTGRAVAWSSSSPNVASVSAAGVVTALDQGTTTITATSEGKSGTAVFTVLPLPVGTVSVTAPAQVFKGHTGVASVALRDTRGNAVTRPVSWGSSNPGVASVTDGVVTGVVPGTATITATSEGIIGGATVTIVPPPLSSIQMAAAPVILQPTQASQVTATPRDVDNQVFSGGGTITWQSSNPAALTVSASGLVTAVAAGTAQITATLGGVTGTITISVPPVASIVVTAPSPSRQPGQTTQAAASLLDASNTAVINRSITWSSSAPSVASVSASGLVTAIAAGTTTITATSEGINGTILITVPPVVTVSLTTPTPSRQPGQTAQVTATLLDVAGATATNRTVTWASSSPAVATVTSSGFVTALASGTTTITGTSEGVNGTIVITVPPVATVNVTAVPSALLVTQTVQTSAALLDASGNAATNRVVNWSSGTPAVATVSSTGLVTAVSLGTSIVSATSEGKTGTIIIQVVPPVGSVQVTGAPQSLLKTQTAQLSALILDTFGAQVTAIQPVWTSSNPAKATISNTGLVTAVGVSSLANVTFTATAAGVSSGATVAIVGHPPETLPELPRVLINTAMPSAPAAGRSVIPVLPSDDFQAKLNSAQPGDVLELAPGAQFVGNFTLPNKVGTEWIVIRPANYASLPAEGTRMSPATAASLNLPKLMTPNTQPAIQPLPSAHNYRFVGIEVSFTAAASINYGLINTEGVGTQNTLAAVPTNITFDRMYIHGTPNGLLRRCVALNSAYTAVIDSYLSDCHDSGQDAQAIAGWNGPGPFKIVNNYLEASTENVIFGGTDPKINNLVPSDIEIRRNHMIKPPAWKNVWLAKNLLELKNAQRVLIEGNVIQNSWADGQIGYGVVLWSANQDGTAPWTTSSDITFRYNMMMNVASGMVITSTSSNAPAVGARRYLISDNVITNINTGIFTGEGRGFVILKDMVDLTIMHNTVISPTLTAVTYGGSPASTHTYVRDNIIDGGTYCIAGDGVLGTGALSLHAPDGVWSANVLVCGASGNPVGNFYVGSVASIGMQNPPTNFALSPGSPYINAGSDGITIGANISALQVVIAGVVVP